MFLNFYLCKKIRESKRVINSAKDNLIFSYDIIFQWQNMEYIFEIYQLIEGRWRELAEANIFLTRLLKKIVRKNTGIAQ